MASTRPLLRLLLLPLLAGPLLRSQLPLNFPLQVRPTGSFVGLRLLDIDEDRAKALKLSETMGVEVAAVEEGTPAEQAGMRPGDIVLSYNGEKVLGVQQFVRLVGETPPGRRVRFVCWRSNAQKDVVVTTASRTSTPPDDMELTKLRVMDVPSPLMLWRNLALGVDSEPLNEQLAQAFGVKQGILIWSVTPSYPAQRAGLRAGDIVTSFCGHTIHSPRELGLIMQQAPNGQKAIALELVRDHKTLSVTIPADSDR